MPSKLIALAIDFKAFHQDTEQRVQQKPYLQSPLSSNHAILTIDSHL